MQPLYTVIGAFSHTRKTTTKKWKDKLDSQLPIFKGTPVWLKTHMYILYVYMQIFG